MELGGWRSGGHGGPPLRGERPATTFPPGCRTPNAVSRHKRPTMTQIIRPALLDEADLLHALTGRSTLSWGYEPEFLDWEPESIAVTREFLAGEVAYVLEEDGRVLGYYALTGQIPDLQFDKLFL